MKERTANDDTMLYFLNGEDLKTDCEQRNMNMK